VDSVLHRNQHRFRIPSPAIPIAQRLTR
jgi:hypothetical protein